MSTDSHFSQSSPAKSANESHNDTDSPKPSAARSFGSIFSIPPPVKRVFDRFPLVVYEQNALPLRSSTRNDAHVLHVFTKEDDARTGRPSYNPACLKWQTYLKFRSLAFDTVPSNNHASPSGALPFLLPATSKGHVTGSQNAIPAKRLKKWLGTQKDLPGETEPADARYEAYVALIDHRIRKAWLYQFYVCHSNRALAHETYIEPCSSQPLVQLTIAHQLRNAAEAELTKSSDSGVTSGKEVMQNAEEAFEALSTLLGDDEWFFGQSEPGSFDASVFAYTYLLVSGSLAWRENLLGSVLHRYVNLVQHQARIADRYY